MELPPPAPRPARLGSKRAAWIGPAPDPPSLTQEKSGAPGGGTPLSVFRGPREEGGACETGSKTGGIPGRRRGCRRLHTAARGRRRGRRSLVKMRRWQGGGGHRRTSLRQTRGRRRRVRRVYMGLSARSGAAAPGRRKVPPRISGVRGRRRTPGSKLVRRRRRRQSRSTRSPTGGCRGRPDRDRSAR